MSEDVIPSPVGEFEKYIKAVRTADPITQLWMAGVKYLSPPAEFAIMRGLEFLMRLKMIRSECKEKGEECVRKRIEQEVGLPYNIVEQGINNLVATTTTLLALSPSSNKIFQKVVEIILLQGKASIQYKIVGFSSGRGVNVANLAKVIEGGEE
jgi:hypothetical protein